MPWKVVITSIPENTPESFTIPGDGRSGILPIGFVRDLQEVTTQVWKQIKENGAFIYFYETNARIIPIRSILNIDVSQE